MNELVSIFTSTLSMSVPLILAALGGVLSVRCGVMALGLESMMTMGAFCGVLGSYYTESAVMGIVCGIMGGATFGLAAKYYCHFTSPIRRYPDLQIHRIIKYNLHGKMHGEKEKKMFDHVTEVAKQSSMRERRAEEA